jgi:hypothetical protein
LEKAKSLSLCNKDNIKNTKILIFIFKLMPFLLKDNKEDLFDKLEDYYTQNNSNYKKFIKYYKKNLLKNIYINYTEFTNEEYFSRRNNYLERFHKHLFDTLECTHPKDSYLVDRYREYVKLLYNKITNSLINKTDEVEKKFSVIDDIINFITLYDKKYKVDLILIIFCNVVMI